jgi:hypothetical protein
MGQFLGMRKKPPGAGESASAQQAANDKKSEKQRIDKLLEDLLKGPLVDFGSARKDVHKLARGSVVEITKKVAAAALAGNLPAAKYLFEMSGIYPVSEQDSGGIEEGSLAETLLKYLGLPTTLKSDEEDASPSAQSNQEEETDPLRGSAEELQVPELDGNQEKDHPELPTHEAMRPCSDEMKID